MDEAVVLCPAKINLFLNVIGQENDRHLLKMVNQSIDIYDYLKIKRNDTGEIKITCDNDMVPTDETNTCYEAAAYMQSYYNIWDGFDIHIEKHIPIGSGLGGESTDAAGVLHAINQMYELELPKTELASVGNLIGADVPFCVVGGAGVVEGTGQIITPILTKLDYRYLVVKPGFTINTGEAFEAFDNATAEYKEFAFIPGLNELEIVAPDNIRVIKEVLAGSGAYFANMTGSGPAVVGGFLSNTSRLRALRAIRKRFEDYQTFMAEPCDGVNVILKRQLN